MIAAVPNETAVTRPVGVTRTTTLSDVSNMREGLLTTVPSTVRTVTVSWRVAPRTRFRNSGLTVTS